MNEMPALHLLIGKPAVRVPAVDWTSVHERLGFRLPADYREFIDAYGPGTFGDIRIAAPGAAGDMDLFTLLERKHSQVTEGRRLGGSPFYPEPGGTISWGETSGGWTCRWAPVDVDPDAWTVVGIKPSRSFRGFRLAPGVSFSAVLKEHAQPTELTYPQVPGRDPAAGPVTFKPYEP